MTSPTLLPPTPEELWEKTLDQLKLQMTPATFNAWFISTSVAEAQDGTWTIAVKNLYAKEWLENRMFDVVVRALKFCTGQDDITLEFIVSKNGQSPDIPFEFDIADYLPDDLDDLDDLTSPDYSQFVPHVKDINKKVGYVALNKYYINYCEPYLTRRWNTAGRRAWVMYEKLIALDTRKIMDKNFTNWSPIIEINYDQLGKLLGIHQSLVKGRLRHCQKYEEDRKFGQPRGQDCCLRHQEHGCEIKKSGRAVLHCYYWYTGILEILGAEGWVTVESVGRNKYHTLKLQVWHSLPYLTPFQVKFLPRDLQESHRSWLIKNGTRLNFSYAEWNDIPDTAESFLNQNTLDYEVSRIFFNQHQVNPYKQE